MGAWAGWEKQLLAELGAPDTPANRKFLDQWASTGQPNCKNNPVGATLPVPGSNRCRKVSGSVFIQSYGSRKQGLAATVKQLHDPPAHDLLAVLKSGDPFTDFDWQLVEGALGVWGSHEFAVKYGKEAQAAIAEEGVSAVAGSDATRSLAGYSHLSHTMSRTIPARLTRASRLHRETLAILRRGH